MPIHGCCRILSRTSKCLITSTSTTSITSSSSDHIIQNLQGIPERAGTAILLLHNGEPRSNFYAKQFLVRLLQRHFSLPKWLSSPLVDVYFKLSELPRRCVQELSQYGSYLDTMHELSNKLEKSIQPLIPEFGPIRCLPVCDLEEPISIERQLRHTFRSGLDNLILLNISPLLKSEQLSAQLAEVHKRINAQSSKLMDGDQQEGTSEYVLRNLPSSFSLLVIDHLARSESLVQYWAERIIPLLGKYEFIIFTTAYPLFRFSQCANDLEKVSRRIMYAAYKQSPRTTSWRTTFYSGWEQPIGPLFSLTRLNIRTCLSKLAKKGQKGPVLVVPLDSLVQGLNTNTALRSAMEALSTKYKIPADILLPEPLDKALVHSLAELVKHIMLNKEKYSK